VTDPVIQTGFFLRAAKRKFFFAGLVFAASARPATFAKIFCPDESFGLFLTPLDNFPGMFTQQR
jgi:hypothetical protein